MTTDLFTERFDGAEAWRALSPEQQELIGGMALELIVAWHGQENADRTHEASRPYDLADTVLIAALQAEVHHALAEDFARWTDQGVNPVPSQIGPCCRRCGCTQNDACLDGTTGDVCGWAEENLCSRCAAGHAEAAL